jgi:hypothetical protein
VAAVNDEKKDMERGERLLELMGEGGWEKKDLADEVGVHESRVHAWLKGEPIGSKSAGRLAKLLETPRRYLISGKGPRFIGSREGVDVEEMDERAKAEKADRQASRKARQRRV